MEFSNHITYLYLIVKIIKSKDDSSIWTECYGSYANTMIKSWWWNSFDLKVINLNSYIKFIKFQDLRFLRDLSSLASFQYSSSFSLIWGEDWSFIPSSVVLKLIYINWKCYRQIKTMNQWSSKLQLFLEGIFNTLRRINYEYQVDQTVQISLFNL